MLTGKSCAAKLAQTTAAVQLIKFVNKFCILYFLQAFKIRTTNEAIGIFIRKSVKVP